MTAHTITETVHLVTETCCRCAVVFAMPAALNDRRRSDLGEFYCPNGHGQHYTGESDAATIRRLTRDVANAEEQARVEHAAVVRLRREAKRQASRAKAGVCPCCNRSFVQLARHMASKHPNHGTS